MCNDFIGNLFRKLFTKFYQNCASFVEDITDNILVSLFLYTGIIFKKLLHLHM